MYCTRCQNVKVINLYLSSEAKAPGKLKAIFETRIYELSGAFSTENKVFDYSPYSRYVGMQIPKSDDEYRDMLYTNKDQTLYFAVLDPEGNPVKEGVNLSVNLYKLEWYWWWEADEESANYTNSRYTQHIKNWNISAKGGKAELKMKVTRSSSTPLPPTPGRPISRTRATRKLDRCGGRKNPDDRRID